MGKKTRLFFGFLLFVMAAAALLGTFYGRRQAAIEQPTPSPAPQQRAWRSVVPGKTTFGDLIARLGQPVGQKQDPVDPSSSLYLFPSSSEHRPNEVAVTGGAVSFIKEYVFLKDNVSFRAVAGQFSKQPTILFGPDARAGISLYVYPDEGAAVLADASRDAVYERWYFPPAPIASLLQTPRFASYSLRPPQGPEFSP